LVSWRAAGTIAVAVVRAGVVAIAICGRECGLVEGCTKKKI
jgi:hypothetical protein